MQYWLCLVRSRRDVGAVANQPESESFEKLIRPAVSPPPRGSVMSAIMAKTPTKVQRVQKRPQLSRERVRRGTLSVKRRLLARAQVRARRYAWHGIIMYHRQDRERAQAVS